MVMKVQGRRKRGRPKKRWLDKVKDDIGEKGLLADGVYTTVLPGGLCHRTSTPHKSGNKMKEKKMLSHCLRTSFITKWYLKLAHKNEQFLILVTSDDIIVQGLT